jgi:hypothetical protein
MLTGKSQKLLEEMIVWAASLLNFSDQQFMVDLQEIMMGVEENSRKLIIQEINTWIVWRTMEREHEKVSMKFNVKPPTQTLIPQIILPIFKKKIESWVPSKGDKEKILDNFFAEMDAEVSAIKVSESTSSTLKDKKAEVLVTFESQTIVEFNNNVFVQDEEESAVYKTL